MNRKQFFVGLIFVTVVVASIFAQSGRRSLSAINAQADFDSLAVVYDPNTPYALPHALFVIDRQNKNRIYYVNTRLYKFHKDFVNGTYLSLERGEDFFQNNYLKPNRRFILGTIAYQTPVRKWTLEFWEGDLIPADQIKLAYDVINKSFFTPVGTVMEDTHIPLNKWLIAFYIMCASKTQVSALQLQRQLEIGSYRSAWFMCHRIRYALKDHSPSDLLTGTIEADETFLGGRKRGRGRAYKGNKTPVVSLLERGGRVRSNVVDSLMGTEITRVLRRHVSRDAILHTDESPAYLKIGQEFARHESVNHRKEEYARRDQFGRLITTNSVEGFFGNSKRSLDGTHHHISSKHADLYFAELDYKYNTRTETDGARTSTAIPKIEGKRLMLRKPRISDE